LSEFHFIGNYLKYCAFKTKATLLRFRWGRGRNNSAPVQQQQSTRRAEAEQEKSEKPGKSRKMKSNVNQGGYAPPGFGSGFQPNAPPAEGFGYPRRVAPPIHRAPVNSNRRRPWITWVPKMSLLRWL